MDGYDAPAMRFSVENDFEGGEFGEDGEFYALGQKKGKRQSKNSAIYGVFHESSDDEGRGGSKKSYTAPLGFVSGGLKGSELKGEEKDEDDGSDGSYMSDDGDEDQHVGLGARRRFGKKHKKEEEEEGEGEERVPQRESELPTSFGAQKEKEEKKPASKDVDYESLHRLKSMDAGGKAFKMLQKM
eukprot:310160-Hanusia_phi.AAC.1